MCFQGIYFNYIYLKIEDEFCIIENSILRINFDSKFFFFISNLKYLSHFL